MKRPLELTGREDLLESEDVKIMDTVDQCPNIEVKIQGVKTEALIDTGSEITCISESFFENNKNKFKNCEILPIVGMSVVGATGVKPVKLKHQLYADLNLNEETYSSVFIIIPKLNKNCILGADLLKKLKGRIDMDQNYIILQNEDKQTEIKFLNNKEKSIKIIHEINMEPDGELTSIDPKDVLIEENYPEKNEDFRNVKEYDQIEEKYCITDDEIEEKVARCELLDGEEKRKFWEVLKKYRDIFLKKPGRISIYEHKLKIKDDQPFIIKTYPIPMSLRELVTAEINNLLELGIIRRSNSPYINPLVTSLKKDGSVRICLDARKLNDIMINDYECAEPTEVLFQRCGGSKIMSTMDLTSSFWQIPLAEESKKYTAFLHEGKCYEFCVTPFGLKTSTAALVRALDFVLNGLGNFYVTFIDDIFCSSENINQHLHHLELLFQRLWENNLTINLEKSHFFRSEVKFLGHILTSTGIKPDPEKIETIQNFSRPRNLKELRGFLGLINFYTKFSKNHAAKIVPLLELLKKGIKWSWDDKTERTFQGIKTLFCSSVLLNYPDIKKLFYLQTDASDLALGAVLFQLDEDGNTCPIVYASRTLKGAELAYYTTEKELLAIVWALQKFRSYVMGGKIVIRTDHKALIFLKTCKLLSGRLTRWIMAIQDYDISIEHCPGKNNSVADTLSRLSGSEDNQKVNHGNGKIILYALAKRPSSSLPNQFQNFSQEQKSDPILQQKINEVEEKKTNKYENYDGLLYLVNGENKRLCVTKSIIRDLIDECHEMYTHIGPLKVIKMLNEHFYYPKLAKMVRQRLSTCDSCQRNKVSNQTCFSEMQNYLPEKPNEILSIDFYGPLPSSKGGFKYILSTIDTFSKFVVLYPLRRANTKAVISKLSKDHFPKYGKPLKIITDHGTQFTSPQWSNFLKETSIQQVFSSIRHPQGNIVERIHRELSRFFRSLVKENHSSWWSWIKIIESCMNETHHETTEFTPIEVHLHKKPKQAWENWLNFPPNDPKINYERKLEMAKENISKKGLKRAAKFNRDHRLTALKEGDTVLVKAINESDAKRKILKKFLQIYEGPYQVKKQIRPGTFILWNPESKEERGMFHSQDLKLYKKREDNSQDKEVSE